MQTHPALLLPCFTHYFCISACFAFWPQVYLPHPSEKFPLSLSPYFFLPPLLPPSLVSSQGLTPPWNAHIHLDMSRSLLQVFHTAQGTLLRWRADAGMGAQSLQRLRRKEWQLPALLSWPHLEWGHLQQDSAHLSPREAPVSDARPLGPFTRSRGAQPLAATSTSLLLFPHVPGGSQGNTSCPNTPPG